MSPPILAAAATVFSVAGASTLLSCSAITKIKRSEGNLIMTILVIAEHDNKVRGRGQHFIVVFSDYQDSHDQITFASFFSFSTSSATDLTLIPALRAAGASTFTVLLVEAVETPKASGVSTSRGFFLAFMMFGRDA